MPKTNVYLPADLVEALRAHEGLNVSAICQRALRKELAMIDLQDRVVLRVGADGDERDPLHEVTFEGTLLLEMEGGNWETRVYRTKRGRIAVYGWNERDQQGQLRDFDDVAEMATDPDFDDELISQIATAMGESRPVELDI